jgi:hypothetical protein
MVKLIDKAIVINVKIHKNERKRLYSSNKEKCSCPSNTVARMNLSHMGKRPINKPICLQPQQVCKHNNKNFE